MEAKSPLPLRLPRRHFMVIRHRTLHTRCRQEVAAAPAPAQVRAQKPTLRPLVTNIRRLFIWMLLRQRSPIRSLIMEQATGSTKATLPLQLTRHSTRVPLGISAVMATTKVYISTTVRLGLRTIQTLIERMTQTRLPLCSKTFNDFMIGTMRVKRVEPFQRRFPSMIMLR